jgi:DNA mismatch repair protein MutS
VNSGDQLAVEHTATALASAPMSGISAPMTAHTLPAQPNENAPGGHVTPSMAQYIEIKAANPDCLLFYRMGDFYELFFDDAETASRALGIVLTKRGKHHGQDIPMCGVPVSRADDYLQRLIGLGHRVAVCEQLEDPAEARKRGAKAIVRRDVVRLVTPGTITEDGLLSPAQANLFVAVARHKLGENDWQYGLSAIDISTGRFSVSACTGAQLSTELARLDPREIVVPDQLYDDLSLREVWRQTRAALSPVPRDGLDADAARRRIEEFFGVSTLEGFGQFSRVEIAAAGLALSYVARTQRDHRPSLKVLSSDAAMQVMQIDASTRLSLELVRTLSGERQGSLLSEIDRTHTPGGGRMLHERLSSPLANVDAIVRRHASVELLITEQNLRTDIRDVLKQVPDMARALSRLSLDRGGPRDLAAITAGLKVARMIGDTLAGHYALPDELADAALTLSSLTTVLPDRLRSELIDEPPSLKRDGGFVREGCDPALDEFRALQVDSRRFIAELQSRYAVETGLRVLRIKHNNVLGYFIEVPQAAGGELLGEAWRSIFIHRQTMAGAMRFSTVELNELETRIASAADRALRLELSRFDEWVRQTVTEAEAISAATEALSIIDVSTGLAELAVDLDWVRPVVDSTTRFEIEGGRHPVVEAALRRDGHPFVANDTRLSTNDAAEIVIITGPNMAGKSTFLRQNALIAILAQMGSFVPARRAHIGVIDRLFSRVGAADDLARGRSTFMVEMVETAAILNQASSSSLVILDEIGRGTATFDGLSIAWAVVEHLHAVNQCRSLFATHFHELTALAERLPRIRNVTVRVSEWNGDVIFLHEVIPGAADRSYGIQVAKLAGLPAAATLRARAILDELERGEREKPAISIIDDLPLFSALAQPVFKPNEPAKRDPVREELSKLHPDEMSPRDALEALYVLKRVSQSQD